MFNFLELNTRTHLRRNQSQRLSLPYTKAQEVGIIFTVEDKAKHMQVKEFIKRLEQDGKRVTVLCHLPNDKQNYEFLFDFFSDKDFGVLGNLMSVSAIKFTSTVFDYLLYLDTDPNPLILNLLARSKARCRIGKHWDQGQPFLELMIKSAGDTKALIDSIYQYANLFR